MIYNKNFKTRLINDLIRILKLLRSMGRFNEIFKDDENMAMIKFNNIR